MQRTIKFRRLIPIAAAIIAVVVMASCTPTKRYGCPNHMFVPPIVSQ